MDLLLVLVVRRVVVRVVPRGKNSLRADRVATVVRLRAARHAAALRRPRRLLPSLPPCDRRRQRVVPGDDGRLLAAPHDGEVQEVEEGEDASSHGAAHRGVLRARPAASALTVSPWFTLEARAPPGGTAVDAVVVGQLRSSRSVLSFQ